MSTVLQTQGKLSPSVRDRVISILNKFKIEMDYGYLLGVYYSIDRLQLSASSGRVTSSGARKKIVYCIDSVEIYNLASNSQRGRENYHFKNYLLGMTDTEERMGGFLLRDKVNTETLLFDTFSDVSLCWLRPYSFELDRSLDVATEENVEAWERLRSFVDSVKSNKHSTRDLNQIENYIQSSNPEISFKRFQHKFGKILPTAYLPYLSPSTNPVNIYSRAKFGSKVKPLDELIYANRIDSDWSKLGMILDSENSLRSRLKENLKELNLINEDLQDPYISDSSLRDIEALAIICSLNEICDKNRINIEFQIVSRAHMLLNWAAALKDTGFSCSVIHPFFCPEHYGARAKGIDSKFDDSLWRRDIGAKIGDAATKINGWISPIISEIQTFRLKDYQGNSDNLGVSHHSEDEGVVLNPDIKKEIMETTAAIATTLNSVNASTFAREKDAHSNEIVEFASHVKGAVTNQEIVGFFDSLGKILSSKNVQQAIDKEIYDVEKVYIELIAQNFPHENSTISILDLGPIAYIKFGWGYMRPLFCITTKECLSVLRKFSVENDQNTNGSQWEKYQVTSIEFYHAIKSIDEKSLDSLLYYEKSLITGVLLASMGRHLAASKSISRKLGDVEKLIDTTTSFSHESKDTLPLLIVIREILLLRQFCLRALAFDEGVLFSSQSKTTGRARRDLYFAHRIQNQIRNSDQGLHGEASFFYVKFCILDEPRLMFSQIGGHLEIILNYHRATVQRQESIGESVIKSAERKKIQITSSHQNTWSLMGSLERCERFKRKISLFHEGKSDQYMLKYQYGRALQMQLTIFLLMIIDSNSKVGSALFDTLTNPPKSDLLLLANFQDWYEELVKLNEENSFRCTSKHVIEPVVQMFVEVSNLRGDNNEDRIAKFNGVLTKCIDQLRNFLMREQGPRFRKRGFYWQLGDFLVERIEQELFE